jgi:hypothetical protein
MDFLKDSTYHLEQSVKVVRENFNSNPRDEIAKDDLDEDEEDGGDEEFNKRD